MHTAHGQTPQCERRGTCGAPKRKMAAHDHSCAHCVLRQRGDTAWMRRGSVGGHSSRQCDRSHTARKRNPFSGPAATNPGERHGRGERERNMERERRAGWECERRNDLGKRVVHGSRDSSLARQRDGDGQQPNRSPSKRFSPSRAARRHRGECLADGSDGTNRRRASVHRKHNGNG